MIYFLIHIIMKHTFFLTKSLFILIILSSCSDNASPENPIDTPSQNTQQGQEVELDEETSQLLEELLGEVNGE